MTQGVRVSVLVVTYNSADEIAACLDALLRQKVPGGLEVVVVDNASTDGTPEVLQRYGDRVRVVLHDRNVGYAPANNEALALSAGQVVALVNPDCVVDPGCLATLADHLADSAGVGMAAAMLHNPDGTPQLFARRSLNLRETLFAFTHTGLQWDRRLRGGRHEAARRYAAQWPPTEPMAVDCPAAACVVIWRHLAAPRLFDPAFPLLYNDADLDRRLTARGYLIEVVPAATAVHGYGTSLRRVARARLRAERIASLRRFSAADWGGVRLCLLWLALVLDCLLVLPFALRGRRSGINRDHVRGTLGGLGLPGGKPPWLANVPGPVGRLKAMLRRLRNRPRYHLRRASRRFRRRWFLWRLRCGAWLVGSTLTTDIHPTADITRDVRIELKPRRQIIVRMGPLAAIQAGALLRLGGTLDMGRNGQIRYDVSLNVNGELQLRGRNQIGRGTVIHADGVQVWEWGACASEYVTVVDTYHGHDGSPVHVHDQGLVLKPISIGAGTLLGAKSSVMPGVHIGRGVIVGTGSVVTRDLPDGCVAIGSPAKPREVAPPLPPQPARKSVPRKRVAR
ncbi:MAG: glycosyl transferase [Frankiales bacterium]|nr:glycosyl transferase [Frankiales bacterium]